MHRSAGGILSALATALLMAAAAPSSAACQPSSPVANATVVVLHTGDTVAIVGARTLALVSEANLKADLKRRADLDAALARIGTYQADSAAFVAFRVAAERALRNDSVMVQLQRQQIADLKKDVELHKEKLRKSAPLISVEAGGGLSRDGLAAIAGVGVRRLRVWGTLQDQGSGVFAGLFLPIF